MTRFVLSLFFTFFLFDAFCSAQSLQKRIVPQIESELYLSQQWTADQGLPQTSVVDIHQAQNGYIWLATFGGLVRYDGVQFQVFNRSSHPEMVSDRILNIAEDTTGTLWISTESGGMSFKNNRFAPLKIPLPLQQINFIQVDFEGTVWIHKQNTELFYVDGDTTVLVGKMRGTYSLNQQKELLFTDLSHFIKIRKNVKNDTIATFTKRLPLNVRGITQSRDNAYWIASNDSGLFKYKDGILSEIDTKNGLPSTYANALFTDKSGTIWNLTNNNVYQIKNDTVVTLHTFPKLNSASYFSFLEDREGSIWIGSYTEGLIRLRKSYVSMIDKTEGMENENLLSLAFDPQETLFFSTNCKGISHYKHGKVHNLENEYVLLNNCPWSLLFDTSGNLFVASRGITVFKPSGDKLILTVNEGLISNTIFAQYQAKDGTIWVGTKDGVSWIRNDTIVKSLTEKDGLVNNEVRVFHEANDGSMWMGTHNGLSQYKNGKITSHDFIPNLRTHYFRAINEQADGTLWFGTYGGGIVRLKNELFSVITTKQGLFDDIVSHLVEDNEGYFWSGSNRGISKISIEQLNQVADGKLDRIQVQVFGKQEGLLSVETNGGFQPSAIKDKTGKMYFPTVKGIAVINPKNVQVNAQEPPVIIDRITYNNEVFVSPTRVEFEYNPFYLEIEYTGLSFIDPSKVQFRYKMEGYDQQWIDAGARRTAFYSNLPPGEFTFTVMASNNDGVWNRTGASFELVILPPFYLNPWFQILASISLILLALGIYITRVNVLKNRQKQNEEFALKLINSQEQERYRIANELHDGVGQYMMVIKNQLKQLQNVFNDNPKAMEYVAEALQNSETAIEDLRHIARDLRPVHLERFGLTETLRQLIASLITSTEMEITAEIEPIDELVDKTKDIHVYRLVQEAINNIYKHAKATELTIRVQPEHEHITIEIRDNGIGFDPHLSFDGQGLIGMHERTLLLGGNIQIQSVPKQGTRIFLFIPIQKS